MQPVKPELKPFLSLRVDVGQAHHVGKTGDGDRKLVPITGGSFSGEITGEILNGGSDALIIRADGCAELNARYCLQAENGALIFAQDEGYRHGSDDVIQQLAQGEEVDPALYYFRTCMRLETANKQYQWINKTLFIGSGCKTKTQVLIDLYRLL
jgi:hypothetical protein